MARPASGPPARDTAALVQERQPDGTHGTGQVAGDLTGWAAEVVVDRAFFDQGGEDPALFPADTPPRFVELTGTRSLIGRRSRSRGIFPDIDLSLAPEDRGVSRAHAILDHPADGSLTVTDLGSANGTWVGDGRKPLVRGVATRLGDGVCIYIGSWTRIIFRSRRQPTE